MVIRKIVILGFIALLLSACNQAAVRDPEYAPIRPAIPAQAYQPNGAIYHPGSDIRLFEDLKARRIGDILTVRLVESTDASKSSDTSINKSTTTDIDNPTILGTSPEFDVPGFFPLANTNGLNLDTNLSSNSAFTGDSETSQANSLSGNITVSVVEVLPNGNLVVRGEKRVTLNNGNEYVRLSGIVRPVDIQTGNTVDSTRIADASIVYTGDGQTHEPNIMGWLARFFISALLPF